MNRTYGSFVKLQLNETIPHGTHTLSYVSNTGRSFKGKFEVKPFWFDDEWKYRKGIVIDNTHGQKLKNYQVAIDPKLTITDGLVFAAHIGDNGSWVIDYSGKNNDGKLV